MKGSRACSGRGAALALVLAALARGAAGCEPRPGDVREWRASDHSHGANEAPPDPNLPPLEDNDPTLVAMAVYNTQCAACHGREGRGDGPQAAMVRPADLTTPAFQAARTDEQLRAVIARGRGSMPAFGETIRPEGIDALVRLVREFGRRRDERH